MVDSSGGKLAGDVERAVFIDLVDDEAEGVFPENDGEGIGTQEARDDGGDGPGEHPELVGRGKAGDAGTHPDEGENDEGGEDTACRSREEFARFQREVHQDEDVMSRVDEEAQSEPDPVEGRGCLPPGAEDAEWVDAVDEEPKPTAESRADEDVPHQDGEVVGKASGFQNPRRAPLWFYEEGEVREDGE